jgi:hypothetical protein
MSDKAMKTVRQWLETLPKELRESALKQVDKHSSNINVESLSIAIDASFFWHITKEGAEFWDSFYTALKWAERKDKNV